MIKWRKSEWIGFLLVLLSLGFASCQSSPVQKKKAVPTAHVPKDSLIQIIRDIADYVVMPNPSDSGFAVVLVPWLEKYSINFRGKNEDTSTHIIINASFEDPDPLAGDFVAIGSDDRDSAVWLTVDDLTKAFGTYEEGIFDDKIPLPKEPDWYAIYTIYTSSHVPAYICVHAFRSGSLIIRFIEIQNTKHFYPLKNK